MCYLFCFKSMKWNQSHLRYIIRDQFQIGTLLNVIPVARYLCVDRALVNTIKPQSLAPPLMNLHQDKLWPDPGLPG